MNIKKRIVTIATSLVAFASVGSITASAYSIITTNPATLYYNVSVYEGRYNGTYADFNAYVHTTTVEARPDNVNNRYKYAYYAQYRKLSNGYWNLIVQESQNGNGASVTTPYASVGNDVKRRIHEGYSRQNSSSTSPIIETYKATITSPGY